MKFQSQHRIAGLPPFDVHKAFNYRIMLSSLNKSIKYIIKKEVLNIRDWGRAIIFEESKMLFQINPDSKILFLSASVIYNRLDLKKAFHQVAYTAGEGKYDFVNCEKTATFKFWRTFKLISYQFTWIITLLKEGYSIKQVITILPLLIEIWDKTRLLNQNVKLSKYKLCVLFYDANCIDNYFSQIFQNEGVITTTLQHGVIISERKEIQGNPDFCGIEFKNFVSSYFLVWNEFTKREAIHSGIAAERIKVLGVIKCINSMIIKQKKNGVIGLLLDGEFEAENNISLIDIVGRFAYKYGYKVYLRFHPRMNNSTYENLYDKTIFSVCEKNIPLTNFVSQTEFCIVANSTAFIEMVCWGASIYRYSSRNLKDKFLDMDFPSFNSFDELEMLYKTKNIPIHLCYKEIIGSPNVQNTYADFFKLFY